MADPEIYKRIFSLVASGKSIIVLVDSTQDDVTGISRHFGLWMSSNVRAILSSTELLLINGSYVAFRRLINSVPPMHNPEHWSVVIWPKDLGIDGFPI